MTKTTSWHSFRIDVERDLAARFERDVMHPAPSRDVAAGVASAAIRSLKRMFTTRVTPRNAASAIYSACVERSEQGVR